MNNTRISSWVIIAFAVTGLLIGFVTGLSRTPVVRGLLPLLFSVIGGGAGFFAVTKAESSRSIGIALTAVSFMALAGVTEGIVVRDGITWKELFAGRKEVVLPASTGGNAYRYVRVLAIKLRMQRLDVSPQELNQLMSLTGAAKDEDLVQVENTVLALEKAVSPSSTVDISRSLASQDPEQLKKRMKELGLNPDGIAQLRQKTPIFSKPSDAVNILPAK